MASNYVTYIVIGAACFLAMIIFRIGRQLLASTRCIEEETLIDFWNGRLRKESEEEYRRVVNHLGTCQKCRDRLDDITQNNKARHNVDDAMISRRF